MSKRKRKPIGGRGLAVAAQPAVPLAVPPHPPSEYRNFLTNHIKPRIPRGKAGNMLRREISSWPDVPNTPQGQIVNDIARKFNNTPHILGINNVSYTRAAGQPNFYDGMTQGGGTRMILSPPPHGRAGAGPNPLSVGHELIHANDHQIDFLNPLVWQNIRALANTGNAGGPMNSLDTLNASLTKIKNKIDPNGGFGALVNYPFDQQYIKDEMMGAKNDNPALPYQLNRAGNYNIPMRGAAGNRLPDWGQLFGDINAATTTIAPPNTIPNRGYYLNRASEFPAYMMENLTNRWQTNIGPDPLNLSEARVIHSTLGNMDNAYPAQDYPIMNRHIRDRRNSIADAYYPPAAGDAPGSGIPAAGFSRGGVIRSKSQNNKRGLSDYLNGINNHKRVNFLTF